MAGKLILPPNLVHPTWQRNGAETLLNQEPEFQGINCSASFVFRLSSASVGADVACGPSCVLVASGSGVQADAGGYNATPLLHPLTRCQA